MAVHWRLQGNLKVISASIKAALPKATVYSVGDASHQSQRSDHNPYNWGYGVVVSAIDVMIRNGFTKSHASKLVKELIGRPDIQYVIYNRTIWSASWGWSARRYTGRDPHTDHVHVSAKHTRTADRFVAPLEMFGPSAVSPVKAKPIASKPTAVPAYSGKVHYARRRPVYSAEVKKWQAKMKSRGWRIKVDGYFGRESERILRQFQKEKRIKVDGRLGPVSWRTTWTAKIT